jgi:hypothetical protein
VLLFLKRRRATTKPPAPQEYSDQPAWERRELDGSEVRQELDGSQRNPIKRKPVPQEMVELE